MLPYLITSVLNVSILEEEDYKNQVSMLFRSTVNEYKSKKTEVAMINDRFEQIEKDINSGNNPDKIKWMDKGEKYSKYFAGLENSRQSNNPISKLTTSCGNNASGDSSILKKMAFFTKNSTHHRIQLRIKSNHILTK